MAVMLIFMMLFSQTFTFSPYDTARADQEKYIDLISLIVDRGTYNDLKSKIETYARDIQQHLGSTRVKILVTDPATTPAMIAAHNEKLYYEGDSDYNNEKSRLVGTILVGNVPIAMVGSEGKYFPSVYPYVDFDHKTFIYNERSNAYEKAILMSGGNDAVEIWHGVINPAIGREWRDDDIREIADFLDKTHRFYAKEGVFADDDNQKAPRVFYFDGFGESKSITPKNAFQYLLRIKNAENIAYQRFTKKMLATINAEIQKFDQKNDAEHNALIEELQSQNPSEFGNTKLSSGLSEDQIKNTPDIQTEPIITEMLSPFHEVFNKKILGDNLAAIHNAGRYNSGATVRADTTAVQITVMDQLAMDTIKSINDSVKNRFLEDFKQKQYFRKIAIADAVVAGFGETSKLPYQNYFFGTAAKDIVSANQCTIARGNNKNNGFSSGTLVEANAAFDVNSVE